MPNRSKFAAIAFAAILVFPAMPLIAAVKPSPLISQTAPAKTAPVVSEDDSDRPSSAATISFTVLQILIFLLPALYLLPGLAMSKQHLDHARE